MTSPADKKVATPSVRHHRSEEQEEDGKEKVSGTGESLDNMTRKTLSCNGVAVENQSREEGSTELSISFVAREIESCNPTSAECVGGALTKHVLMAVAIVFGVHGPNVSASYWNSLFHLQKSENALREHILDLIVEAYRLEHGHGVERGDEINASLPTYKNISNQLVWICTPDTARRNFFARYLQKLCDAKEGFRSKIIHRNRLGVEIVHLAKLTPQFQHSRIWKKNLLIPQHITLFFPRPHYMTDADESEDEDDDNIKQYEEAQVQIMLAPIQVELHKLKEYTITHVKYASELVQRLKDLNPTMGKKTEELGIKAIGSSFDNFVILQETLGARNTDNIIDLVRGFWSSLTATAKPINAVNFAKDVVKAMGYSEERLRFLVNDESIDDDDEITLDSNDDSCHSFSSSGSESLSPPPSSILSDTDGDINTNVSTSNPNTGTRKRAYGKTCALGEVDTSSSSDDDDDDDGSPAKTCVPNRTKRERQGTSNY